MKFKKLIFASIFVILVASAFTYAVIQEDSPKYYDESYRLDDYNKTLMVPDFNLKVVFFHKAITIPANQPTYKIILDISEYDLPNENYIFVPTLEMKESYIGNVKILGYIRMDKDTIKMYLENNLDQEVNITINGGLMGDLT